MRVMVAILSSWKVGGVSEEGRKDEREGGEGRWREEREREERGSLHKTVL